jgi:hypothetical protein
MENNLIKAKNEQLLFYVVTIVLFLFVLFS